MAIQRIHKGKQPRRPHFVREWAEKRGYPRPVDLANALEADKSLISRWYSGSTPGEEWQDALADLFGYPEERDIIFRHPDDDWFARFFRDRSMEELDRMRQMLEAAFPKKPKQIRKSG
jgi:hypothetical protein